MNEIWKDIEGFEGLYQVSDLGHVKSLARVYTHRNRWGSLQSHRLSERLLKPARSNDGYYSVTLTQDHKSVTKLLHRLVAQAFIPNPDNLPQVNHKDENPSNNCAENLEWCTAKYNSNYGTRTSRLSKSLTGLRRSEEYKQNMHNAREGSGNPMYGKSHTSEFKEARRKQMSEMRAGKHPWNYGKAMPCSAWNKEKRSRSVSCLDTDQVFSGTDVAAEWLGVTESAIHYAATHVACCKGHVFAYTDNLPEDVATYVAECFSKSRTYKNHDQP